MKYKEVQACLRVYLVAAFLIIRELILDWLYFEDYEKQLNASTLTAKNKWALVTGANGTIGQEIVKNLLRLGYNVHAFVHQQPDGTNNEENLIYHNVDLMKTGQILKIVETIDCTNLDLVVLSAGVMLVEQPFDDVENHMEVNVTSQVLLAEVLREKCAKTTRFVFLSSAAGRAAEVEITSKKSVLATYDGPYSAYAFSKLALSVYVKEAVKRRNWDAITLHPGTVPGGLYQHANFLVKLANQHVLPYVLRSAYKSSVLVLLTALAKDFRSGEYYEEMKIADCYDYLTEREATIVYDSIQDYVDGCLR